MSPFRPKTPSTVIHRSPLNDGSSVRVLKNSNESSVKTSSHTDTADTSLVAGAGSCLCLQFRFKFNLLVSDGTDFCP